ncbi:phosphatidate cytidylyltransferase [Xinfangfangia sp. CPCC 101601]|uniref:Phosphatidate cytidylyltransferase n=1 Tax=Pseudogemmobacter lacusdianii TaxID=3069608 RepID=A0ABU0W291_9RHOB|nr:phosphatidate cytidylyltransferase [Xinfangfangia sp. CPCC 101601]MDQ2068018.1 phosphatidate cytidylyltransferase [Xinfangfangia sp. CPCC 101601]
MTAVASKWGDLAPRILSAAVLLAVGGSAIWVGGLPFALFAIICSGLMTWELARMTKGEGYDASLLLGLLAATVLALNLFVPHFYVVPLLLLPPLIGLVAPRRDAAVFFVYALIILATGWALVALRQSAGLVPVLWLLAVVILSDVAGYFAGRLLGGPKFWPKVSPKKTWSGTVAGWICAALVGLGFWQAGYGAAALLWVSPLVAFAGQLGDIAESAIKRRAGVKDSSGLIPGHGGLLDRFDALAFAAVLAALLLPALQLFARP